MCWRPKQRRDKSLCVSVAGCLGYDVLANQETKSNQTKRVSVAGCLGYDVLETYSTGH